MRMLSIIIRRVAHVITCAPHVITCELYTSCVFIQKSLFSKLEIIIAKLVAGCRFESRVSFALFKATFLRFSCFFEHSFLQSKSYG